MLVLSRKRNEQIVTSNGIRIVVVEIRGDKVRLGIEADKAIRVDRLEIDQTRRKESHEDPR
jgi:carbon storage regulator